MVKTEIPRSLSVTECTLAETSVAELSPELPGGKVTTGRTGALDMTGPKNSTCLQNGADQLMLTYFNK